MKQPIARIYKEDEGRIQKMGVCSMPAKRKKEDGEKQRLEKESAATLAALQICLS